ncbi:MAG: hypothetical protein PVSMB4_11990 [Ktedonobacterales bacterium]
MIDGQAIVQQALQGYAPPGWQILRARQSHFLGTIISGIALTLLVLGLIGYLIVDPGFVIGLRGAVNVDSLHQFWRIVDFIAGGVFAAAFIALTVKGVRDLGTIDNQVLVMMPEGFVMQKGPATKAPLTVAYESTAGARLQIDRGTVYLLLARANRQGALKIEIDGRFGKPKPIAQQIIQAQTAYAAAHVRQS